MDDSQKWQSQAMAAVQEAILEGRDKLVISTSLQLHIISLLSVVLRSLMACLRCFSPC